ncbi:MAG: DUF5652 family protein [Candidatus Paceibacterota bacterium]
MNLQALNVDAASFVSANPWIILLIVWSAVWKLIALWKAARKGHMTIFIVLAILNTAGILEIIYLIVLHFKGEKEQKIQA